LLALLLGVPLVRTARTAAQTATPVAANGDFAGLVDIGGGRRLWLECRGSGSPTVVLESGYGNRGDVWDIDALGPNSSATAVLPGVSAFTRVCAYDRPGTILDVSQRSRSDSAPQPRTVADAVADLHALLSAAGLPGPYVLVGHSLGGIINRLYAATYPDDVAGLVLVDSAHEDQNDRIQTVMTPEQWTAFDKIAQAAPTGLEDYPEFERIDFDASFAQMRAAASATPLRPLPLFVLSHGRPITVDLPAGTLPPGFPADALERTWQELQDDLAALVPGARHVIATKSGHYIQIEQPDLVIEAIRQVVAAVRDPSTWATPAVGA
jgi:pimeloyl-ACP methyl ester carboxylesterase